MNETSQHNKTAWEYNAYEFWMQEVGLPRDRAEKIRANPVIQLGKYAAYFDTFENVKVANICGSCGKKAVPLAALGAEVTVFDISADNCRYAMELAAAAQTSIGYEVVDVLEIDLEKYGGYFDVVFMEGGVLHYFHDIDEFMRIMYALLKPDGRLICSDFHPLTKIMDVLSFQRPTMGYFSNEILEAEMPHAKFYAGEIRQQFPKCRLRLYTLGEIINAVIAAGFTLKRFDEHPAWTNSELPGEFTILAGK